MARTRRLIISGLAAGALSLGICVTAGSAASKSLVTGTSGPLTAKLKPKWPITVTATLSGKPAHATAVYQFLFDGAVVGTGYVKNNKHFSFTGHFSDSLVFPQSSLGEPLTLSVVITSAGHTVKLDWAIKSHT